MKENIFVTKSVKPSEDFITLGIRQIIDSGIYTNRGSMVQKLESELQSRLGTNPCICMTNGTITLQILISLFAQGGEVVTTPFSYIATVSSILWSGATPVFCDIDSQTFNIDVEQIESKITPKTRAILATHVFGVPCDVNKIEKIAREHSLVVIYDAAHAFGTKINGESVFNFGDFSSVSFHATKLFHTVEGGAIFVNNPDHYNSVFRAHNFGHSGLNEFLSVGINAKMSEVHALFGLALLDGVDESIYMRNVISELYKKHLMHVVDFQSCPSYVDYNYAYFPVLFKNESTLLNAVRKLEDNGIYARRYFFPSLNKLPFLKYPHVKCEISESIASRILCLPLYPNLELNVVERISDVIKRAIC